MNVLEFATIVETEPTEKLLRFAKRHVRDAKCYELLGKRTERRNLMVVPAMVQAVDEQGSALGDAIGAVTRDVSPRGIGLFHVERLKTGLYGIRFNIGLHKVRIVTEINWCQGYGPFYYSGGEFIVKWREQHGDERGMVTSE